MHWLEAPAPPEVGGVSYSAACCSSVKPQSHTSGLGSEEELSERTTSSKVRSETVDSILSAVAKKKVSVR